ncbi:MAG: protein-tyrosine-phosphatase [Bacteroidetes bacterium]|nr:protein-tyrosine-phosphatase [Bacteroidota bacterium]
MENKLLTDLNKSVEQAIQDFEKIPDDRKKNLKEIAQYVSGKKEKGDTIDLNFICTHNSRRSHISQLWAQTSAYYYGIPNVFCFSGGTEATAFNPRAVKAMRAAGFKIEQMDTTDNPVYHVHYTNELPPVKAFSKKYGDAFNPQKDFAAIMTCSDADEACPIVYGAAERFAIPYEDPKIADNTPEEETRYNERCRQIASEMFYLFSQIKS